MIYVYDGEGVRAMEGCGYLSKRERKGYLMESAGLFVVGREGRRGYGLGPDDATRTSSRCMSTMASWK
jgi:hypothetical protein